MRSRRESGQALVMVTLSLIAMCGIIGLGVDLGWSFFVKKQAQAAADAAAQAAAQEALKRLGTTYGFTCPASPSGPTDVYCTTGIADCGAIIGVTDSNLRNGCQYAQQNGFTQGGKGGRQSVTVQASTGTPPTAAGVTDIVYWVTVRVTETIPQLFSAVLGNTNGTVSARATAGIVNVAWPPSLILINREGDGVRMDSTNKDTVGINLEGNGGIGLNAPSGIEMASQCYGAGLGGANCTDAAAFASNNSASVTSSRTEFRGTGDKDWSGPWNSPISKGMSEGDQFQDPTRKLPQPPLVAPPGIKTCAVPNGQITNLDPSTPMLVGPYNYFASDLIGTTPTGAPITLQGNIRFSPSGGCPGILSVTGNAPSGGFTSTFFYGGVSIGNSILGNKVTLPTTVTFDPGQYVFVGSVHATGSNPATPLFDASVNSGTTIQSSGSGNDYAGNMFLFTAPGYPGLDSQISSSTQLQSVAGMLYQGQAGFKSGSNGTISVNISGLNKNASTPIPDSLKPYSGTLLWQDRRNSTVRYNADGSIACGNTAPSCAKSQAQMDADLATPDSGVLYLHASPSTSFNGVLYQPRGAWTELQGGGDYNGPLQVVTGSLHMSGSGNVSMLPVTNPFTRLVVALIE